MHKRDQSNVIDQSRRSGSPKTRNASARLEQGEKREASQSAKQSNTPSRDTSLHQFRASIAHHSRQKTRSSANRPVTKSQTKNLSSGPSHQNIYNFFQEISATYLISPSDILQLPRSLAHCVLAEHAIPKVLARQVKI